MAFSDKPAMLTAVTTYLLSQTAKVAKRDLDARLSARGLRLRHMAVLTAVDEGPASQLEFSRRLDMDPSDMTATIDDLEASRLVARRTDPADRRRKLVTLTRPGRTELGRLDAIAREAAESLLAPVPASRRRQLHDDLRRVLEAHELRSRAQT